MQSGRILEEDCSEQFRFGVKDEPLAAVSKCKTGQDFHPEIAAICDTLQPHLPSYESG